MDSTCRSEASPNKIIFDGVSVLTDLIHRSQWAFKLGLRGGSFGPQAEYLNEQERRVYVLARGVARPLGLEVDEVCRRYAELQRRLKDGTPEAAVDFYNDHGSKIRHGASTGMVYDEYVEDLEKRGAGDYHVRDCKRYAGGFVAAFPTMLSKITSAEIDKYLSNLGGKRTITKWKDAGLLIFIQVRRVVRYDVGACDESLRNNSIISPL